MKSKIFIAILFFSIGFIVHSFLMTRKQNKEKENSCLHTNRSMNEPVHAIPELEDSILKAGKRDYYEELQISYLDRNSYEFLPWALLMANKYNDTGAYLDVYICLFELSNLYDSAGLENWSLDNLDNKTQKMAIEYLNKAAEKGHHQAKEILGKYYLEGRYVEKNTALGNRLIKE